MSEFSSFLLVPEAPAHVVARLASRKKSAWVFPNRSPWSVVVGPKEGALQSVNFPRAISYDYAADHGLYLRLFLGGKPAARLKAESEVGHVWDFAPAPWVAAGVITRTKAAGLATLLKSEKWQHSLIRQRAAVAFNVTFEGWLSWDYLRRDEDAVFERHPEAIRLINGVRENRKDVLEAAFDEVEEILDAEAKLPPRAPKPRPTLTPPLFSREEALAISALANAAPPLQEPKVELVANVDLASCLSGREWLDMKKRLDAVRADAKTVKELERTIRDGRFPEEGDRADVVREAAAMLLGRWLRAKEVDRAAWVGARISAARTSVERTAWEIVARVAGVHE